MTIEIRELVIEARVADARERPGEPVVGTGALKDWPLLEREKLIDIVVLRVLKALRDQRED